MREKFTCKCSKMEELPRDYFTQQKRLLRIIGVEVTSNETVLFKIYSVFAIFFIFIYIMVETIEAFYHTDLFTIVVSCNYSISHFLGNHN